MRLSEWISASRARKIFSRSTVRSAMQRLVDMGMIERCPGVGTRVLASAAAGGGISADIDLIGPLRDAGELVTHSFEHITVPLDIAKQLDIPRGLAMLKIVRLRVLDGIKIRMTIHYIPGLPGQRLKPEMLGQRQILDILAELGAAGQSARDTIGATLADAFYADLLDVEVGAPLLDMNRIVRNKGGEAILLQNTIVPPERQKLRIDVEGDERGLSPATWLGQRLPPR